MLAMQVVPGRPQTACLADVPEPDLPRGHVLVRTLTVGLCGTDREIAGASAVAGSAASGPIILGHEVMGRVESAPARGGFGVGDLVMGTIRRPCPELCDWCRLGRLDECVSPALHERGISGLDGFGCELWTAAPEYLVRLDSGLGIVGTLAEPLTSVVKGLRRLRKQRELRGRHDSSALVTGAGTIGLLAAAVLCRDGLDVSLVDPNASPARLAAAAAIGASLAKASDARAAGFDIAVECSGSPAALADCVRLTSKGADVLVLGIPAPATAIGGIESSHISDLVLGDKTLIGSVNASKADHEEAANLLMLLPRDGLLQIVTREVRPEQWMKVVDGDPNHIKTVIRFAQ